jgi:hypothetical protein
VTVDEAVRDLLNISTDVRRVAVLGPDDELLASGPDPASGEVAAAGGRLWKAAAARAAVSDDSASLDHVVVQDADGAVAVLERDGRHIVALTGPRPAIGLLVFDLRTCLGDAFGAEEAS